MSATVKPGGEEAALIEACALLGLVPPFSVEEARARYRDLAKIYHPDAGKHGSGEMFARLNDALALTDKNAEVLARTKLGLQGARSAALAVSQEVLDDLHKTKKRQVELEGEVSRLKLENNLHIRRAAAPSARRWLRRAFTTFLVLLGVTAGATFSFFLFRPPEQLTLDSAALQMPQFKALVEKVPRENFIEVLVIPEEVQISTATLRVRGLRAQLVSPDLLKVSTRIELTSITITLPGAKNPETTQTVIPVIPSVSALATDLHVSHPHSAQLRSGQSGTSETPLPPPGAYTSASTSGQVEPKRFPPGSLPSSGKVSP